jgi:hypothetical protein
MGSWSGDVVDPQLTSAERKDWEATIENEFHLLISALDPREDLVACDSTNEEKREAIAILREREAD